MPRVSVACNCIDDMAEVAVKLFDIPNPANESAKPCRYAKERMLSVIFILRR
jgi:hypothetical protein